MTEPAAAQMRLRRTWVIVLTIAISLLFFTMVRPFIVTVLMAAIFSGISHPLYRWLAESRVLRKRSRAGSAAAVITLVAVLLLIVLPLVTLLGIVAEQAVSVSQRVGPWVQEQASKPDTFDRLMDRFPVLEPLKPYEDKIIEKFGDIAGRVGQFLVASLAHVTRGAAVFLFHLFIMIYAMFFFLKDGKRMLDQLLRMLPLAERDQQHMVEKFVSVSRATIKGTLVIGIVQGVLAGLSFWIAGIPNTVFWGTIMAVLSIIPGVGAALVWIPGVIYLIVVGNVATAVGVGLWCAIVVGTADNFLRPRLVGRDTKMHDLLILLATLGGLVMFGALGIVLGPVLAALFLTVWGIFDSTMNEWVGTPASSEVSG
jgi:predicted PurR-regulated permease PerM